MSIRSTGGLLALKKAATAISLAAAMMAAGAASAADQVAQANTGLLGKVLGGVQQLLGGSAASGASNNLLQLPRNQTPAAGAPAAINKYTNQPIPNGSVLLVWTGDGCSTPVCNPATAQDFLAVLDAEPNSTTYGNVIWTAELPKVLVSNVLPVALSGAASDSHNDPHHMLSYTSYISGGGDGLQRGRKYQFAGGVISKNVFRFDVTSVRNIGRADLAVCGTQVRRSSLTDDFVVMPSTTGNHKILYTYMSNYVYGPGGSVTEIEPDRVAPTAAGVCLATAPAVLPLLESVQVGGLVGNIPGLITDDSNLLGHTGITEYGAAVRANQPRNPTNYTSYPDLRPSRSRNQGAFYLGNDDVGIEALPHGMALTYDGKYLVSSDYAVAASIGAAAINGALRGICNQAAFNPGATPRPLGVCGSTFGSSVRVFEASGEYNRGKTRDSLKEANVYASNPYVRSVSAVPDGPRVEAVLFHEENEGLMPFGMPHQSHHCKNQKGWVNLSDPSYDLAITPQGVLANATSDVEIDDCRPGDPDYVPHDGAFTGAMCGGTLFYSPDIRIRGDETNVFGGKGPYWRAVYDVGPCPGVSYFSVSDDDRFLIQPISGIESPASIDPVGAVEFDRDYPREHSRRLLTVDIRPLLAKGRANTPETAIQCDFPPYDPARPSGSSLGAWASRQDRSGGISSRFNILKHNNEADDCPRIRGVVGQFEDGPTGVGGQTTLSSNTSQLGTGYLRAAQIIEEISVGNPRGILLNRTQTGGEPSGTGGGPGSGNLNSLQNLYTHGGPHFTTIDRIGYQQTPAGEGGYLDLSPKDNGYGLGVPRDAVVGGAPAQGVQRYAFIQYFVELNHVPGPGTGSDGDRTLCLAKFDRRTGATVLDTSFTDELLGTPCVDFDSAARDAWLWPGARGVKGGAKPHAAVFERDGAALFGPGYYPAAPLDVDGPR